MRRISIILFFLLIMPVTALFSQDYVPVNDWLSLKDNISSLYSVVESSVGDNHVRIESSLSGDRKTVVVMFPKRSSAYDTALDRILNVFYEKNITADFDIINFGGDTDRGLSALEYAETINANLIFSMGSGSTSFIHSRYSGGRLPVVSVCSKDPVLMGQMEDYENGSGTNMAYTSLNVPIELQMEYLKLLMPDLERIMILYAVNNSSAVITQVEPLREICKDQGIESIDIAVQDQNDAKAELEVLIPNAVRTAAAADPDATKSIFWITGSTSVFREIATINKYSRNYPVLSVVPDVVSPGEDSAVLSIGVSFESNAHIAALQGSGILLGEYDPGSLKVGVVTPPDIAINFLKAKEIGLSIPFAFFESATYVYDYEGILVRAAGQRVDE